MISQFIDKSIHRKLTNYFDVEENLAILWFDLLIYLLLLLVFTIIYNSKKEILTDPLQLCQLTYHLTVFLSRVVHW